MAPSAASPLPSRGPTTSAGRVNTKVVGGAMFLIILALFVFAQMNIPAGPPSGKLQQQQRRRQLIIDSDEHSLLGDERDNTSPSDADERARQQGEPAPPTAATAAAAAAVLSVQPPPPMKPDTKRRRRTLNPKHAALIEATVEHVICDPSAADCQVQRPLQTFDAYKQSDLAPEMLLLEKRNVSRLFVVPPPLRMAHPQNAERRISAVVGFAMWLLTSVDAQGAVVLTARSPDQYESLCAALVDARRNSLEPGAWGNVFVSSVAFAPLPASFPRTRPPSSLAPTDVEIDEQREAELRKATAPPTSADEEDVPDPDPVPALHWHLAGLDAAQERYTADSVVLFDTAPPPRAVYTEHTQSAFAASIGSPCNASVTAAGVAAAPPANESLVPSDVLYVLLRRSAWRFWFVTAPPLRGDGAAARALWRLAVDSNATEVQPPIMTIEALLAARRGGSGTPPETGVFRRMDLESIAADPYRRCGRRRFDGAVVQIGGTSEMVTIDNALAVLVRNPQWLLAIVVANSGHRFAGWLEKLPHFFLANVRLYAGGVAEGPCRDFQDKLDFAAIDFGRAEDRTCLAAMALRANESAVFQPWPPTAESSAAAGAGGGPIVLMPLRDAVVFAGDLTAALSSNARNASASASTAIPIPSPHDAVAVVFPTAARLTETAYVADQDAAAQALGLSIASDCWVGTAQPGAASASGNNNYTSSAPLPSFAGLAVDVRSFGQRSPSAQRSSRWAERDGSPWPSGDVDAALNAAERNGAVVLFPVGGNKGPVNAPWRYHVRRRRIDPKSVQAMHPTDKAKLWCNPETFEGCQPSIADTIRKSRHCASRNHVDSPRRSIECEMQRDDRVRKQDYRPSPATTLRRPMPSVVGKNNTANLTAAQLRETPFERDVDRRVGGGAAGVNDSRVQVDVLISVITHGHGHADQVEQAESWLEYCPTCVLVYEEGPQEADLGATYDIMKKGLAPDVFDRLIVNPKAGLHLPVSAPRLIRHMHNIKYARCFVSPLRVLMVAGNEAPFRPGMAEYMLSHNSVGMRDVRSLVAESDDEGDRVWMDAFMLSTTPRLTQAAQQFAYGSQWEAFEWTPFGFYHCSGKTFFDQTRSGLSSAYGFEGTWFTGAQWLVVERVFQQGYWTEPEGYVEHQYVQVPALEGELLRLYGSPPAISKNRTAASPNPFFVAKSKPLGRNTCFLARLRRPYNIALDELKSAIAERSEKFQFSVKRVGPARNDDGRRWLREVRKRELGIIDRDIEAARKNREAEDKKAKGDAAGHEPQTATAAPRKSTRRRRRSLRDE